MPTTITLLTPGMSREQSKAVTSSVSALLGASVALRCLDPSSEDDRRTAAHALKTREVDAALAWAGSFDTHVLPESRVPVVVLPTDRDRIEAVPGWHGLYPANSVPRDHRRMTYIRTCRAARVTSSDPPPRTPTRPPAHSSSALASLTPRTTKRASATA